MRDVRARAIGGQLNCRLVASGRVTVAAFKGKKTANPIGKFRAASCHYFRRGEKRRVRPKAGRVHGRVEEGVIGGQCHNGKLDQAIADA